MQWVWRLRDEQNGEWEEDVYNKGKGGDLIQQLLSTFSAHSQAPFWGKIPV
jgi:hypothetical protein